MANASVTVNRRAPDFSLLQTRGPGSGPQECTLSDYLDRWLLLLFYPRDFTLVCPTELLSISARIAEFQERECDVLAISTDSIATHDRWLSTPRSQGGLLGLNFPLASDESGEMCRSYGVYVPKQHLALRGLFIIDPNGVLQYQVVHNLSVGRSTEEVLRVLEGLQTGGLCPADWEQGQAPMDLSQSLAPNHVLGNYRIESVLGSGSFGTVFRARDLMLDRLVALKVRKGGSSSSADSVLVEARAAAALNHANICAVHGLEDHQGSSVIVMEYLDGRTLSDLLSEGPLEHGLAVSLGRQIASGLAAAHTHGIVHGDLKPANIMVMQDHTAKVLDFGLASRMQSAVDDETMDWSPARGDSSGISGTPRFMAPEQVHGGAATPPSDVFALGLILYEMVTGRNAVSDGPLLDVLQRIDQIDPALYATEVPEPFSAILRQALIKDVPQRRIAMAEIAASLA